MTTPFRKALATVFWLPATTSLLLVRGYRLILSPDHSWVRHFFPYGYCRHEPTCSTYAETELQTTLFPVAILRIGKRIASCHPWGKTDEKRLQEAVKKALE